MKMARGRRYWTACSQESCKVVTSDLFLGVNEGDPPVTRACGFTFASTNGSRMASNARVKKSAHLNWRMAGAAAKSLTDRQMTWILCKIRQCFLAQALLQMVQERCFSHSCWSGHENQQCSCRFMNRIPDHTICGGQCWVSNGVCSKVIPSSFIALLQQFAWKQRRLWCPCHYRYSSYSSNSSSSRSRTSASGEPLFSCWLSETEIPSAGVTFGCPSGAKVK